MSDPGELSTAHNGRSAAGVYARISDAVFGLDDEWRFTFLNEQAARLLGGEEADLLGESVWEECPEAVGSNVREQYQKAMSTREPASFVAPYPPLDRWFEVRTFPAETGITVQLSDATDRKRREQGLLDAYAVIADSERSFEEQVDALLEIVRNALGTDYATLSRIHEDAGEYVFEAVAAPPDADLRAGDTVSLTATNCERAAATERTLVLEDVATDAPELADRAGNAEWGISCYVGTPVTVDGEVYGTFCFYDMDARSEPFSEWEVTFVNLLADWVSSELERRRYIDRLTALNDLYGVVYDITDAVINQSTREAVEAVTCQHLADGDSYQFAWIGEIDPSTEAINVRAEADVENYLDDITALTEQERHGPTAQAFRTGEIQIVQNVETDPTHEQRRATAAAYGYQSSAAVPIVHEGSVYGVLNVYADRPTAFEAEERAVVELLGQLLGHAIASIDRNQALLSESVVELEFRVRDALAAWDVPDRPEGPLTVTEIIPTRSDGEYLAYGTAAAATVESIEAVVDTDPHWEAITRLRETDTGIDFELRVSETSLLAAVASINGELKDLVIDEGDCHVTVHLPPDADVRQCLETVRATATDVQIVSKRETVPADDPSQRVGRILADGLTDRQREALRAAFFAGFFEYPRDTSGEEVAETLGVSPPTFHQHRRAAEHKLFDALLTDSTE